MSDGKTTGNGQLDEPGVQAEPAGGGAAPGSRRRGGAGRRFRRLALALLVLGLAVALVPVALTFVYLSPSVRPVSTLMVKDLVTGRDYERRWVPLAQISPHLVHSVIMSEDGQFCSHRGVDWAALNAVIDDALAGEPTRGASTIPMQTVKNLFLWHGRSFLRKAMEVPMAIGYDAVTPKKRIIEVYLNIAEWAPGIYGAEAAAQHHFGKPARALTRRQAALLAVTLPAPAVRNPARPTPGLNRLAAVIERRAMQAGSHVRCLR